MCTDGVHLYIHTVPGAKRGALVETSAMPLLLQGLRGRAEEKICWQHILNSCGMLWRLKEILGLGANSCFRIQMFQSLLVCLTLSQLESITRLRRLVLRIHPSAGACKHLAKRPNIVKSLKGTSSANAACVSKSLTYMFPKYMSKAVIPYVERFFCFFWIHKVKKCNVMNYCLTFNVGCTKAENKWGWV